MNTNKTAALVLVLIVTLSALALALRVFLTSGDKTAVVYQNGEVIREIDIDGIKEPVEFTIYGDNGETNTIRAEHGRIRVVSASCPDKICVNRGWISDSVVPIVCLPNKITIEIRSREGGNDIDGMAGG